MVQVIIGGLIQMITQAMVVVALEVEIILVLLPGLQDMGAHKVPVVQVGFIAVGQVEQMVFLVTEERVLQELAAVAAGAPRRSNGPPRASAVEVTNRRRDSVIGWAMAWSGPTSPFQRGGQAHAQRLKADAVARGDGRLGLQAGARTSRTRA